MRVKSKDSGKLRIGDDWNAIRIIALSQSNPLKAIAEFVENSIDAHAKTITIIRGKEHKAHYLAIKDDGDGVPYSALGSTCFGKLDQRLNEIFERRGVDLAPMLWRLGVGGERLGQHGFCLTRYDSRNREADSTDQAHDANQSRGFIQPMIE